MRRKYNPEHRKYLLQHQRCELCQVSGPLELHHIVPIVAGGRDVHRNWIAICPSCHRKLTPSSELIHVAKDRIRNGPGNFWIRFFNEVEKRMDVWDAIEFIEEQTLSQNTFNYKEE